MSKRSIRVGKLPKNETPADLRYYATHEALCRHSISDVLMWLADTLEDQRPSRARALHNRIHWCTTDDEQAEVFERGVLWPCPTLKALDADGVRG